MQKGAAKQLSSGRRMGDIPAVLLVGGMGTRLRPVVQSAPKPLAPIGSKPFLDLLVRQLRHQGVRRVVMCTGYLAEQIENVFNDGRAWDLTVEYSKEASPLGTAGAVKLAQRHLRDAPEFLVMNGDSFLEVDFQKLIRFHRERGGIVTIAVRQVANSFRYGRVQLEAHGRVTAFLEKNGSNTCGIVNAGVYVFNQAILEHIPEGPCSLETEVFPCLLDQGVYGLEQQGMFIDIGTPDDYELAQKLRRRLYAAAADRQQGRFAKVS